MIPHVNMLMASSTTAVDGKALLFTSLGIAAFLFLLRWIGLYLAKTHPEASPPPARPAAAAPAEVDAKIFAIIAAAVAEVLPGSHRIVSIAPQAPSVESLMQQWSMEGRRAIYSSHRFR